MAKTPTPSLAVPTPPPAPPVLPTAPTPVAEKSKPKPKKQAPAPTPAPTVPPAAAPVVTTVTPATLPEALARIAELEKAIVGNATIRHEAEKRIRAVEEEVGFSTEVRSQKLADKLFDGPKMFFVVRPDNPGLTIRAHDEHQARARYDHHCGIRGSEHPATVTEVEEAPEPTPAFGKNAKRKSSGVTAIPQ
ncbi:MAG: hypothetical protein KGJ13_09355 [Patescibacteria group bacterium]|nr:hypothetical protein [Patescibacteria group bacterium]